MPEKARNLYSPYHEMDPLQFAGVADQIRREKETMTRLKLYRERMGLSQSELARASGVSWRIIQHYEQRRKDLNRAQAQTLKDLAAALHCSVEDLNAYFAAFLRHDRFHIQPMNPDHDLLSKPAVANPVIIFGVFPSHGIAPFVHAF